MNCQQYSVTTGDGVTLRVYRLPAPGQSSLPPVVLVHGTYANSQFWLSDKGVGLAAYLRERGHDVWMPELRGRGPSAKVPGYVRWSAGDLMRHDLAAVAELVDARQGRPAMWVGHSYGGLYVIGALVNHWLPSDHVAAVAVFGTQLRDGQRYLRFWPLTRLVQATIRAIGFFPARGLGMGPENEPPGIMNEALHWKSSGRWAAPDGTDYEAGIGSLAVPVLAYAAAADKMDPPEGCRAFLQALGGARKEFRLLGECSGFSRDYGHVDMLVSRAAEREVWPDLAAWLAGNREMQSLEP